MVEFKSPIRIIGGEKGDHCFYPLQIDPYGNGCQNGCAYCYAYGLLSFRGKWNSEPAETDVSKIRKIFDSTFKTEKETKWTKIFRERVPVRIGGMTDPFTAKEKVAGKTAELLDLLNEYDYPYIIFTKNSMVADDEYLARLNPELASVQISITSREQSLVDVIEPNASSTSERLTTVEKLVDAGIYTGVRIAPIIPMFPDGTFSHGDGTSDISFPYFSFQLVHDINTVHPDLVIAEMCRFTPFIIKSFASRDIDVKPLLNEYSIKRGTTTFLSLEERDVYYSRIESLVASPFSVCELDNFDYFKKYWSNQNDCCGVLGKVSKCTKTWHS